MITIKPFRGLRPADGYAEDMVAPPYDVLDSDEARDFASHRRYSFLHVIKPEIDLPAGIDLHDPRVYAKGMENLKTYIDRSLLVQEESPCLYIYELRMGNHRQAGLLAVAAVEDYVTGRIKKHEYTRLEKEEDRASHIDCLNAQTGPAFMLYRARDDIADMIQLRMTGKPDYQFVGDHDVEHTLYIVRDPEWIENMVAVFRTVEALYIADGHHRTAAAARVREKRMKNNPAHTGMEPYNFFLTVIFPHDQLHILDYNRVVKDLNNYSPNAFIEAVGESFIVEPHVPRGGEKTPFRPGRMHEFGMYLMGKWYRLAARPGTFADNDPVGVLDVTILQENLLAPVLDIQNPRTNNRIHFVGGIRGLGELERLVDHGRYAVAFSMYPTSVDQLMAIADANRVMPPKSTWFEPKLGSGLITHLLDVD
ncbi:MAG TPA: DUF1015 domain-containing protein [bacterium]|nr:DUF1015 domain-containing protein [bacterium]